MSVIHALLNLDARNYADPIKQTCYALSQGWGIPQVAEHVNLSCEEVMIIDTAYSYLENQRADKEQQDAESYLKTFN